MPHWHSKNRKVNMNVLCELKIIFCFFDYSYIYSLAQGQATDIAIQAEEIVKLKKLLNELMSKHTHQPVDVIGKKWMSTPHISVTVFVKPLCL